MKILRIFQRTLVNWLADEFSVDTALVVRSLLIFSDGGSHELLECEETDLADFTPDELQELLERMQADGDELPLSKEAFKERYFAYYDDVKDKSLKKQDW